MDQLSLVPNVRRKNKIVAALSLWFKMSFIINFIIIMSHHCRYKRITCPYEMDNYKKREYLRRLVYGNNDKCISQLRMCQTAFHKLCEMLQSIGRLKPTKNMHVDEQVALFLHILAHHQKNSTISTTFQRSGSTVSIVVHKVLNAVLRLQGHLLKKPTPILPDSTDVQWKWFTNCLGALDGTHIKIRVPIDDQKRYRNRKGEITTNMLGVCTPDMQFVYVLPGWEGSAADGRVLQDALTRKHNLQVLHGSYYLVDAGYANSEGFLAPYRGQRYHLSEWRMVVAQHLLKSSLI